MCPLPAQAGGIYKPSLRHVRLIERRFGDEVRNQFGIEPSALTADEAKYLANFRNADALGNSIAKAKGERAQRLSGKGVRSSGTGQERLAAATGLSLTPKAEGRYHLVQPI